MTNSFTSKWPIYLIICEIVVAIALGMKIRGDLSLTTLLFICNWLALAFPVTVGVYYSVRWQRVYPFGSVLTILGVYLLSLMFIGPDLSIGLAPGVGVTIFSLAIALPYVKRTSTITRKVRYWMVLCLLIIMWVMTHLLALLLINTTLLNNSEGINIPQLPIRTEDGVLPNYPTQPVPIPPQNPD